MSAQESQHMPEEARRKGNKDTLYSAEWFEGEAAKAAGGKRRVLILLGLLTGLGILTVFILGAAGLAAYLVLA